MRIGGLQVIAAPEELPESGATRQVDGGNGACPLTDNTAAWIAHR